MAGSRRDRRIYLGLGLALLTALALTLSACGSDSSSSSSSSTSGGSETAAGSTEGESSEGGSAFVAEAQAAVKKAESPNGTYTLPEPGPAAVKGKNVWVVSCGLAAEACALPAKAVEEAAKTLDWKVTTYDGKFTPTEYSAGIRQAIAAKADGIIVVAIDCVNAKAALESAKSANIPVVGVYAYDCSDPLVGGPELFAATINSNGDPAEWALNNARLRADYAIAMTDGEAKVLSLDQPEFIVAKYWTKGFEEGLEKCTSCAIEENVEFTSADLANGSASQQKLTTALLQHPETNVLFETSDALLQTTLPAVKTAKQQNPDLIVIANEGFPATQELIRSGLVNAAVGIYVPWMGWSGADAMNRVFAGETEIPNEGLGYHLMTEENLPASGNWEPTLDYQSAFEEIWNGENE